MARPRTPTNVLEMRGAFATHPERRKERTNEPQEERELGDPPKHFNVDQIAAWNELADMGRSWLTFADRAILTLAASLYADVKMYGTLVASKQATLLSKVLAQIGLATVDRSRVIARAKGETKNPFSGIGKRPSPA